MDRCFTCGTCLFQVFRQWRVAQNRAEGEKSERKELGERRVSSPSLPASNAFLCTVPTIWSPGITGFSGANRLGYGLKKKPQENHECLKVTYDQAFFFLE